MKKSKLPQKEKELQAVTQSIQHSKGQQELRGPQPPLSCPYVRKKKEQDFLIYLICIPVK